MMRLLLAVLALVLATPAAAQDAGEARKAIEVAMTDSAAGWNAGSLDRFLGIYSTDPATSFTTAKGLARGTGAIREQFIEDYPQVFGPAAVAGALKLSFAFEDLRMLGAEHAQLIARWRLEPAAAGGETLTGMTTLLFRKEAGGWKIIADHSS